MPTLTTNFSLNKPVVNSATDEDLWGGYLNDNMDTIDSTAKVARDRVTRAITTTDSVVAGDRNKALLCDASGGAWTLTLIAAATAATGFEVIIKKTDSSGNAITIDGNASETIDGATTYSLSGQYNAVVLVSDGSNWHIAAKVTSSAAVASASTSAEGIVELATTAETQTGTDSARVVTPAGLNGAINFSNYYTSSEQSITSGSAITLTHSLGAIPKLMVAELVCKTTDGGWAVGDRVLIDTYIGTSGNVGLGIGYSTTQITLIPASSGIQAVNKSSGAQFTITNASWRLVARAWA